MRWGIAIASLTSLVAVASATGVLLPLYVYPSTEWNDGAANWKPVFNAISSQSSLQWLVVVNPENGPGATHKPGNTDTNYITGTSKLNGYKNVKTIGYVRTNYAASPMSELKTNITAWSNWSTYTMSNIAVHGIFFDESSTSNYDYLNTAITFARKTFKKPITVVCNFGVKAGARFYKICDVVLAFESALNQSDVPPYKGKTTLKNSIPAGYEAQGAIMVNHFTGKAIDGSAATVKLLNSYLSVISGYGIGWTYFCSADYDTVTVGPATVGQLAKSLAAANA